MNFPCSTARTFSARASKCDSWLQNALRIGKMTVNPFDHDNDDASMVQWYHASCMFRVRRHGPTYVSLLSHLMPEHVDDILNIRACRHTGSSTSTHVYIQGASTRSHVCVVAVVFPCRSTSIRLCIFNRCSSPKTFPKVGLWPCE